MSNKTYQISKEKIENLPILATGYKAINWDLSTKGKSSFRYGETDENIVGQVWKVDGDLNACKWGLHFSKDPANVFDFYAPLGYNRYFKVNAYETIVDTQDNCKTVAQIISFVEEYDLMQFIDLIKQYDRTSADSNGISYSEGISYSNGISYSYGINNSEGINGSEGITGSNGISYSYGINGSEGINGSYGINGSNSISYSYGINGSNSISYSYGINNSEGISYSYGINNSNSISYSYGITGSNGISYSYGINGSNGISYSYGINNSEGVSRSIFCTNQEGIKLHAFNKPITEQRYNEIYQKILDFDWHPNFANWYDIKGNKEWWAFCFPQLQNVDTKTAWSKMPKEMLDYIKGLPEYDETVFKTITE